MVFRTQYSPVHAPFSLGPDKPIFFFGSCFAQNLSARLRDNLWMAPNPAGTLFNPVSVAKAVNMMIMDKDWLKEFCYSIYKDNGEIFHSLLFGTSFSGLDLNNLKQHFTDTVKFTRECFSNSEALFITFGTSFIYTLNMEKKMKAKEFMSCNFDIENDTLSPFMSENEYVVGNCHKLPSFLFERRRMDSHGIVEIWTPLIQNLHSVNPNLHIIFTVSPVRHLKDGFHDNALSKATLLIAIDELCRRNECCSYFPSFEILNDDLRDYRFYAQDMVHPSSQAVEYIFDIFKDTYLQSDALMALNEGEKILKGWLHNPLVADSLKEQQRIAALRERHKMLSSKWNAILPLPPHITNHI